MFRVDKLLFAQLRKMFRAVNTFKIPYRHTNRDPVILNAALRKSFQSREELTKSKFKYLLALPAFLKSICIIGRRKHSHCRCVQTYLRLKKYSFAACRLLDSAIIQFYCAHPVYCCNCIFQGKTSPVQWILYNF